MLAKENVPEFNANMGAPIIFVLKPNSKLRLCVDYQSLNMVPIEDFSPLQLMDELGDKVVNCEWFTKLDLRDGYYLVRQKDEESENATILHTCYRHFKCKVRPCGTVHTLAMSV
jgi:hypothetical protein